MSLRYILSLSLLVAPLFGGWLVQQPQPPKGGWPTLAGNGIGFG